MAATWQREDSTRVVTWQRHGRGGGRPATWQRHGREGAVTWRRHGSNMAETWQRHGSGIGGGGGSVMAARGAAPWQRGGSEKTCGASGDMVGRP